MKALILRQNADSAGATSRVLMEKGFQILCVENQTVAHALIRVDTIDLLVMDERIGGQLTHSIALSGERKNPYLSAIMLTDRGQTETDDLFDLIPCLYALAGTQVPVDLLGKLALSAVSNVQEAMARVARRDAALAEQAAQEAAEAAAQEAAELAANLAAQTVAHVAALTAAADQAADAEAGASIWAPIYTNPPQALPPLLLEDLVTDEAVSPDCTDSVFALPEADRITVPKRFDHTECDDDVIVAEVVAIFQRDESIAPKNIRSAMWQRRLAFESAGRA